MCTLIEVTKDGTRFLKNFPTLADAINHAMRMLEIWDLVGDNAIATKSFTIKPGVYIRGGYWV